MSDVIWKLSDVIIGPSGSESLYLTNLGDVRTWNKSQFCVPLDG